MNTAHRPLTPYTYTALRAWRAQVAAAAKALDDAAALTPQAGTVIRLEVRSTPAPCGPCAHPLPASPPPR